MAAKEIYRIFLDSESVDDLFKCLEQSPDERLANMDIHLVDFNCECDYDCDCDDKFSLMDFAANFGRDRAKIIVDRINKYIGNNKYSYEDEQLRVSAEYMNEMVDIIAPNYSMWVPDS